MPEGAENEFRQSNFFNTALLSFRAGQGLAPSWVSGPM